VPQVAGWPGIGGREAGEKLAPDHLPDERARIGQRSSHTWFALTELIGYPGVKNYDGSQMGYGSLVSVSVEMG